MKRNRHPKDKLTTDPNYWHSVDERGRHCLHCRWSADAHVRSSLRAQSAPAADVGGLRHSDFTRAHVVLSLGMAIVQLAIFVHHCDTLLRTAEVKDWDRAHNGLQVGNHGRVTRLAAAVDASLATVKLAVAAQADLLLVHHGLFWSDTVAWTGQRLELQRLLIENQLAVYSSHLPLDLHPQLGNNAQLAAALGFKKLQPFFFSHGAPIGLRVKVQLSREELCQRLARATGSVPKLLPGGAAQCQHIGIVTGGAGAELKQAAAAGVDTFITGEGPHWTFALAEELGLNVLYGGHYATETFGVKALAAHLARKFRVPWSFLDHPTGL